jgi:hypothetical protein
MTRWKLPHIDASKTAFDIAKTTVGGIASGFANLEGSNVPI